MYVGGQRTMTAVMHKFISRTGVALLGGALVLQLAGCGTPEQLILPAPPPSNSASELTSANRGRPGVLLGEQPDPGTRDASYTRGTGDLIGRPGPRPQQAAASGGTITLNLAQASIPAAAKAVLGDILGADYTVSDKVTGTVTLQTPQPVSRSRLLEMFEAALSTQGAAVVSTGGFYRVLPLEEALASGGRIQARGSRARGS